jgi:transcriptional regulator with XRE-family HTH domain
MLKNVIKEARIDKNIKQEDVAAYVGVTVQTYSKWENGKTEPKASQVAKLSQILKITEHEICLGKKSTRYNLEEFLRKIDQFGSGSALMIATYNCSDHEEFFKELEENKHLDRQPKASDFKQYLE